MYFREIVHIENPKLVLVILFLTDTAGFVYGAMGFVDRSFVGIAIMVVQNYCPSIPKHSVLPLNYFRWILVFVNGGLIFVDLALTAALLFCKKKM